MRIDEGDDDEDDVTLGDGLVEREMSALEEIRADFEEVRTALVDGRRVFEMILVREIRVVADTETVP